MSQYYDTHQPLQGTYVPVQHTPINESEVDDRPASQIVDEWANRMLDQATDEMFAQHIPITPETFSAYFQEHYELPWSVQEAEDWLKEQGYTWEAK